MRLNENRIDAICTAIVDRLAEDEMIDLTISEEDLADVLSVAFQKDLYIEEEIQRDAVEWIRLNRKHMQESTDEWEIELEKQRDLLAIRRGYVLP